MKIYGRIYKITNLINNKSYIGKTIQTIKTRFSKHCSNAKTKKDFCILITKDIKKYGKENFVIEEIDVAYSKKELKLLEGVYISWFNTLIPNGYNTVNIVNGKNKLSEITIKKMRIEAKKPERLKLLSENGKKSRGKSLGGISEYCGVIKHRNKYISSINLDHKRIHLGCYNLESDAAKAYDLKAIELFGCDCNLNFPELRQNYINGEVIIIKSSYQDKSKSGIKNIHFHKQSNGWEVVFFDKNLNKKMTRFFKDLKDAIKFKESL